MKLTIIHILLLLLALLAYQCSYAQDYVLSLRGDTVKGQVKPISYAAEKRVQVTAEGNVRKTFNVLQVREYAFNGERFRPVRFQDSYVFMKVIKEGYLSLYAFQQEGQQTWDGRYLLKRDGDALEVPNLSFKKLMLRFLEDCSSVTSKINSGELGKRNLAEIVDAYNSCIENRTTGYTEIIQTRKEAVLKSSSWEKLLTAVKAQPDFEGKADAVEMIDDIQGRIMRSEKVPNFLVQSLRQALANSPDVKDELDAAIADL